MYCGSMRTDEYAAWVAGKQTGAGRFGTVKNEGNVEVPMRPHEAAFRAIKKECNLCYISGQAYGHFRRSSRG
jgi:hypothetical protein